MKRLTLFFIVVLASFRAYGAEEKEIFSRWEFVPQASVLTPTQIELVQTDFDIPYREILSGFPALHLGIATPLKRMGDFQLFGTARAGFSYKRGYYKIPSSSRSVGDSEFSLLWVPISIGTKFQYTPPEFPFVRPSLSFNLGLQYLRQNSSVEELNTKAWLPYYSITPMIGFFEGGSQWFNGFTFGISFIDSFAVVQKVRSWSFDLSFSFLL